MTGIPLPAIPRYNFGLQDRICVNNIFYTSETSDENCHVLRRVDQPDLCESFSHEQIDVLRQNKTLSVDKDYFLAAQAALRKRSRELHLSDLSMEAQKQVMDRKYFCDEFLKEEAADTATRSDAAMNMAILRIDHAKQKAAQKPRTSRKRSGREITRIHPPSPSTLRRWLRKYEAYNHNPVVLADIFVRSGNRKSRFSAELESLLQEAAETYGDQRKPTLTNVFEKLEEKLEGINLQRMKLGQSTLRLPSMKALDRRVKKLHVMKLFASREGTEKAKKKFSAVMGGLKIERPLERVEMDEWHVHMHSLLPRDVWNALPDGVKTQLEPARIWLYAAIDHATKCFVGLNLSIESPNVGDAMACLHSVVTDKTDLAREAGCKCAWDMFGIPEVLCTDQGTHLVSFEFHAAAIDVGAEILHPPAGFPQMRASIERVFRTLDLGFAQNFHGRTFSNVGEKGDYDAQLVANVTTTELKRHLIRYIVDIYHNQKHKGLGEFTPQHVWRMKMRQYGIQFPLDPDVARSIFGTTVERRLRREGVELFGLFYRDDELQQILRQDGRRTVLVRINPFDLGYVSVRIADGWLTVACADHSKRGVSLGTLACDKRERFLEALEVAQVAKPIVMRARADLNAFRAVSDSRVSALVNPYSSNCIARIADYGLGRVRSEMDVGQGGLCDLLPQDFVAASAEQDATQTADLHVEFSSFDDDSDDDSFSVER